MSQENIEIIRAFMASPSTRGDERFATDAVCSRPAVRRGHATAGAVLVVSAGDRDCSSRPTPELRSGAMQKTAASPRGRPRL